MRNSAEHWGFVVNKIRSKNPQLSRAVRAPDACWEEVACSLPSILFLYPLLHLAPRLFSQGQGSPSASLQCITGTGQTLIPRGNTATIWVPKATAFTLKQVFFQRSV